MITKYFLEWNNYRYSITMLKLQPYNGNRNLAKVISTGKVYGQPYKGGAISLNNELLFETKEAAIEMAKELAQIDLANLEVTKQTVNKQLYQLELL